MGEVYLAEDTRLDRQVALKLLPAEVAADARLLRRFRQEAKIASSISHPNVCVIHEVGETADSQPFIAMEYIDGQTLAATINQRPLELSVLLRLATQITDALDEAHEKGVVHRDLKPGNILVTGRGQAKVLDFGLAKLRAATAAAPISEMPTQAKTESGTVMGTVSYMSPEQARGKEVDCRSDLFSFGIVLYEMATGRLPFAGETTTEVVDRILHAEVEAVARFNYEAPVELERIIRKCLEKERERRYQTAKELLVDLRNLQRDVDSGAVRTSPYEVRKESANEARPSAANVAQMTVADRRWRKVLTSRGWVAIGLTIVLLLGGLGYVLLWRQPAVASQPQIKSLAILPLANLSGDPAQEYFADGMTEALISNLSQIGALQVISRTSAMTYKGSQKSLPEIAQELKVEAILTGSVQRSGARVRVSAQLNHAATDRILWSRVYEREMADVLKLESDVARAVAEEIRIQVTPDERRRLASARRVEPQAQEAYLLGRTHLRYRNESDLSMAIKHFERAIQLEPDYAAAYAGLADAWMERGIWGEMAFKDVEAPARNAARKAIELDGDNAEARATLAHLKFTYDWKWREAEREFNHTLELDPSNPAAHLYYASLLMALGRHSEAIREIESAARLDPLSSWIESGVGRVLYRARRYEEAISHFHHAVELDPRNASAYTRLVDVYVQQGKYDEAIAVIKKCRDLGQDNVFFRVQIARIYALTGKRREALELLGKSKASAFQAASVYAALGDNDAAFRALERAIEARDSLLVFIKEDPPFDSLHADPRSQALLRRMNFPPE